MKLQGPGQAMQWRASLHTRAPRGSLRTNARDSLPRPHAHGKLRRLCIGAAPQPTLDRLRGTLHGPFPAGARPGASVPRLGPPSCTVAVRDVVIIERCAPHPPSAATRIAAVHGQWGSRSTKTSASGRRWRSLAAGPAGAPSRSRLGSAREAPGRPGAGGAPPRRAEIREGDLPGGVRQRGRPRGRPRAVMEKRPPEFAGAERLQGEGPFPFNR